MNSYLTPLQNFAVSIESGDSLHPFIHGDSATIRAASPESAVQNAREWVAGDSSRRDFFNRFSNVRLMIRPASGGRALRVLERI